MLSFISTDSFVIPTNMVRPRLRVYATSNPTDVANREAFSYLIGQTVLIDGVEQVVYGVESYALGGTYRAGRPIGLAVVEDAP